MKTLKTKSEPTHYKKWRAIMQGYEASGLTQIAYCEREGHSFRQFKYFRHRFARLEKKQSVPQAAGIGVPSAFVPLASSVSTSAGLRLALGNGAYCIIRCENDARLVKHLLPGLQ